MEMVERGEGNSGEMKGYAYDDVVKRLEMNG